MKENVYAARNHLSRLIGRIKAGEEVVITRRGRPMARLVPVETQKPRRLGLLKGKGYWIADDFGLA